MKRAYLAKGKYSVSVGHSSYYYYDYCYYGFGGRVEYCTIRRGKVPLSPL